MGKFEEFMFKYGWIVIVIGVVGFCILMGLFFSNINEVGLKSIFESIWYGK